MSGRGASVWPPRGERVQRPRALSHDVASMDDPAVSEYFFCKSNVRSVLDEQDLRRATGEVSHRCRFVGVLITPAQAEIDAHDTLIVGSRNARNDR